MAALLPSFVDKNAGMAAFSGPLSPLLTHAITYTPPLALLLANHCTPTHLLAPPLLIRLLACLLLCPPLQLTLLPAARRKVSIYIMDGGQTDCNACTWACSSQ